MILLLASLGLAAANTCGYAWFASPYTQDLGSWANPALLGGGAAAFLAAPLVLGDRLIAAQRRMRFDVNGPRFLLGSLLLWNGGAAGAYYALTPREELAKRVQWLPKRLSKPAAVSAASPAPAEAKPLSEARPEVAGAAEPAASRSWNPLSWFRRKADPADARHAAFVVIRGRIAAAHLAFEYLDDEFVESHTEAGATESAVVAYALSVGFVFGRGLKGLFEQLQSGAAYDPKELGPIAQELKGFRERWKADLDGFQPGKAGGGRAFLRESLALYRKAASGFDPEVLKQAGADPGKISELARGVLEAATYAAEPGGTVLAQLQPGALGAQQFPLAPSMRLVHEGGRWRADAHLALTEADWLKLLKEARRRQKAR